jgi:hypothetical protein
MHCLRVQHLLETFTKLISTKPSTMLGDQPLGREFCEVVVTCVLKREAVLPRPYADMETMTDVKMMSIAWSYKKR